MFIMIKSYHAGDLLSPALKEVYDKKLDRLDKYGKEMSSEVYLTLDGKKHVTKVILTSGKNTLVASAKSDDMYKNVDLCVDSLKKQLEKVKVDRTKAERYDAPEQLEDEQA